MKSVEENDNLRENSSQLFDNPLKRDFVNLDQLIELFGYKKKWFTQRMTDGSLPYHQVGKKQILFYVPEVRQAILENRLAPNNRKVPNYDRKKKNEMRSKIFSASESAGYQTLEELRNAKRSREMGELC